MHTSLTPDECLCDAPAAMAAVGQKLEGQEPSRILMLQNMASASELATERESILFEVREEAAKFGMVENLEVKRIWQTKLYCHCSACCVRVTSQP